MSLTMKQYGLRCNICSALITLFFVFIGIFFYESSNLVCRVDYMSGDKHKCRAFCSSGRFALSEMQHCHPWLNCYDIEHDILHDESSLLLNSVVKSLYLTKWKGKAVILSKSRTKEYSGDFEEHLKNLKKFSPNQHLVQLVGFCNNSFVITEYHVLGTAFNFKNLILEEPLKKYDPLILRVRLCRDYASILNFLHNPGVDGPRIMCDSSSLEKTLTQYLLTDDLGLVLADLDAIPLVGESGTKCGHRELTGDFIAPEQKWPYPNLPFNDSLMPNYNEKTDIWKVPDVCNWFLGNSREADIVQFRLYPIHNTCKNKDPKLRPTAFDILREYQLILDELTEE